MGCVEVLRPSLSDGLGMTSSGRRLKTRNKHGRHEGEDKKFVAFDRKSPPFA
jgi:hypothetical protein